jgi:hypothetical protein
MSDQQPTTVTVAGKGLARFPTVDFLGHPRGLAILFATEAWERFSYFGNAALVVLYMVKYLLDPGRVEAVMGFAEIKTALEFIFGPLAPQPLASQLFGFYTGSGSARSSRTFPAKSAPFMLRAMTGATAPF